MAMVRSWWLGLFALATGCLEGGPAIPPGRSILPGREARRPTLVRTGPDPGDVFVVYETLKAAGDPWVQSPRLWAVPYQGGPARKLAENGSWPITREETGSVLVLHDVDPDGTQPPVRWYPQTAAALTRMNLASGDALTEFPSIVDFGFWRGRLFLESDRVGQPLRQILVEDEAGAVERLAPAADVKWSGRGEMFLLLPEPARGRGTLVRLRAPGQLPEVLAMEVSQFMLHPSGELLLGRSRAGGHEETWLLDLDAESPPARRALVELAPDCAWLDFVPGTRRLLCVRPARQPGDAAELHLLDLARGGSGDDRTLPIAATDPRQLEIAWSPGGDVGLVRERAHAWLLRPEVEPTLLPLGASAYHPGFSPDGRVVAYIEAQPGDGPDSRERLMVQDVALAAAPRALTPPGAFVQSYSFTDDGSAVLDVSHFGDYKASLYLSDLDSGGRRRVASGIGWSIWPWNHGSVMVEPQVIARGNRVLLVDGWSEQDRVGDLRLVDLGARTNQVLAHAVAGFSVDPPCPSCDPLSPGADVVIAVYERLPSDQDGLWALTLP
jgi:hypothetical protein